MSNASSRGPVLPNAVKRTEEKGTIPGETTSRSASWGLLMSVVLTVIVYFAAQLIAVVCIAATLRLMGWDGSRMEQWLNEATVAQFLYIALAEALTVGAIVWLLRRRHIRLGQIGWGRPRVQHFGTALAWFGVYFVSYIVVAGVAKALIPTLNLEQEQQIGFQQAKAVAELVLTYISLAVLPPIAEEFLFRGFLYTGLRSKLRIWPAILVTSTLFAVGHLQFGSGAPLLWVAALDTFILSVVLCHIREKTGSLWPGIFIHAIKNSLAFTVLFLLK